VASLGLFGQLPVRTYGKRIYTCLLIENFDILYSFILFTVMVKYGTLGFLKGGGLVMTATMTTIVSEHLRELAAGKSKAYELLLTLEGHPEADDSCFQSLAQIVDWIVLHPIALEDGTLDDLRKLLNSETKDLASTLVVLSLALSEAANPGRMHILLSGYPKWMRMVSEAARPHFLGILPNLAAHLDELEESGVETLIDCLNGCTSAHDCEILAGCIARYQETSGKILIASAEIAGVAIRTNSRPLLEKLMIAATPEAMIDSDAAREFLPALVKLKTAAGGEPAWSAAIGVCVTVARNNSSMALHLARQLKGSLAALTEENQLAYLASFQRIVEEAGLALVGYGIKQLPALFQKAGGDHATQFVEQGIAIARRYGKVAAEEYFEQRTGASREASPLR
jgi:hypothetical protein